MSIPAPANYPPGAITPAEYNQEYTYSLRENDTYWAEKAKATLSWFAPFSQVSHGSFEHGDIAWFLNGKINVCYNCVDRHVAHGKGDEIALIFEPDDESAEAEKVTFAQLQRQVCRFANLLKQRDVKKGDVVAIYLPMCPMAAVAMLACARIGAVHSVVFAGFSADALRDRILDAECKIVISATSSTRGGKRIDLKSIVREALLDEVAHTLVKTVLMLQQDNDKCEFDRVTLDLNTLVMQQRPYCPCEWLDSEDPLFVLYTSGSTGRPKGLLHSQAGYLLYASYTHSNTFDIRKGDIFACMADVGWITGHSYIVYGPLCNGVTTLMFGSTPLYPDAGRYWRSVERFGVTQLYTAPTAVRALMRMGAEWPKQSNLSTLRVFGSVGEPINPEAWMWVHENVGVAIVDTYWQTETGGHVLTPLPMHSKKPGFAQYAAFGIEPVLLDPATGKEIQETEAEGVLAFKRPWPGMCRTVLGDHERYLTVYMRAYPGYYFTGDGAKRDADGHLCITGRVDDVINVSGHRIGTAEVESALVSHEAIAESAVVGIPHDIKGQGMVAYCVPVEGACYHADELPVELKLQVRHHIGAFCSVDRVVLTSGLPKTRSGKIMRRLLRKIAQGEQDKSKLGDVSTLADPSVVDQLIALTSGKATLPAHTSATVSSLPSSPTHTGSS
ncbi:MAG: hypothetical protein MHM6MM_002959 [Cercozoa sp. M6MM]